MSKKVTAVPVEFMNQINVVPNYRTNVGTDLVPNPQVPKLPESDVANTLVIQDNDGAINYRKYNTASDSNTITKITENDVYLSYGNKNVVSHHTIYNGIERYNFYITTDTEAKLFEPDNNYLVHNGTLDLSGNETITHTKIYNITNNDYGKSIIYLSGFSNSIRYIFKLTNRDITSTGFDEPDSITLVFPKTMYNYISGDSINGYNADLIFEKDEELSDDNNVAITFKSEYTTLEMGNGGWVYYNTELPMVNTIYFDNIEVTGRDIAFGTKSLNGITNAWIIGTRNSTDNLTIDGLATYLSTHGGYNQSFNTLTQITIVAGGEQVETDITSLIPFIAGSDNPEKCISLNGKHKLSDFIDNEQFLIPIVDYRFMLYKSEANSYLWDYEDGSNQGGSVDGSLLTLNLYNTVTTDKFTVSDYLTGELKETAESLNVGTFGTVNVFIDDGTEDYAEIYIDDVIQSIIKDFSISELNIYVTNNHPTTGHEATMFYTNMLDVTQPKSLDGSCDNSVFNEYHVIRNNRTYLLKLIRSTDSTILSWNINVPDKTVSSDLYIHGVEYSFKGTAEFQNKTNNTWQSVNNDSVEFHLYFSFINNDSTNYVGTNNEKTLQAINAHMPFGDGAGFVIGGTIVNYTLGQVYNAYRIVHTGNTSNKSAVVWCNSVSSDQITDNSLTEGRLYITPKSALVIYSTVNALK